MPRQRPRFLRIARVWYRRALRRMEYGTPVWLRQGTTWGTSLALHGLLLLTLGLLAYSSDDGQAGKATIESALADQLKEDLTSLAPGDKSGDPFTTLETDEPPSLSLDPDQVDPTVTNTPELPPEFTLGPEVNLIAPSPGDLAKVGIGPVADAGGANKDRATLTGGAGGGKPLMAPFSGRGVQMRAAMVRRGGGSRFSEQSVGLGLAWLARHQKADGSWTMDPRAQCKGVGCPPRDAKHASDTAATGLALLPMLGAGMIQTEKGPYQDNVRRAIAWLTAHQKPDGDLFTGGSGIAHMYSHAIGALALCEAYAISQDDTLKGPSQKAVDFIIKAQNPNDGGWRYNPRDPGDTCVFGWQMFALRSAALAGLDVPKDTVKACISYLDSASLDPYKITYAYFPPENPAYSPVMTAEALLCRQYLGWPRDHPPLIEGTIKVFNDLKESKERNIYYVYYATQLLHNMQGEPWEIWNPIVRDGLILMQAKEKGCDRGSWDPNLPLPDRWGKEVGRHFQTCLSLLTLEVYYRYLPLYEARDRNPVVGRSKGKGKGKDGDKKDAKGDDEVPEDEKMAKKEKKE